MVQMTLPRMVRCGRTTSGWSTCCNRHLPAAPTSEARPSGLHVLRLLAACHCVRSLPLDIRLD